MKCYLGLDVHCKETVYVAQDDQGQVIARGAVATNEKGLAHMLSHTQAPPGTAIAMESGTQHFFVAGFLKQAAMSPVVVSAAEVRAKARRRNQKSDSRDAFEICDGLRRGIYTSLVWVPDLRIQRLRKLLSRRRFCVREATRQVNAAKYLLRSDALPCAGRSLASEPCWRRLLEREDVEPVRDFLFRHFEMWLLAKDHLAGLDAIIEEALEPFAEVMDLFVEVPGIGPITSAAFIATLGEPGRFETSKQVISYLGLAPACWDSGGRECHGSITKRGPSACRAALVEAAHHAGRPNHPLYPYFARILSKQGPKRAVVAVAARLARILFQMWKKRQPFDVRRLNVIRDPRVIERKVEYRLATGSAQRKEKPATARSEKNVA